MWGKAFFRIRISIFWIRISIFGTGGQIALTQIWGRETIWGNGGAAEIISPVAGSVRLHDSPLSTRSPYHSAGLSQGPQVQIQYGVLIAIFSCIAISNFFQFVHWLQFWWGNEASAFWQFPGFFCTLFLPFYGHLLSEKCGVHDICFCCGFLFHFSSHDDLIMSLNCSSRNSIIFCWFHPSSSWRGAKNAWNLKWKNWWMPNEFHLLQ